MMSSTWKLSQTYIFYKSNLIENTHSFYFTIDLSHRAKIRNSKSFQCSQGKIKVSLYGETYQR